ncbi:hypothetical protein PSSHI_29050 [Photobacterium sp. R1]
MPIDSCERSTPFGRIVSQFNDCEHKSEYTLPNQLKTDSFLNAYWFTTVFSRQCGGLYRSQNETQGGDGKLSNEMKKAFNRVCWLKARTCLCGLVFVD